MEAARNVRRGYVPQSICVSAQPLLQPARKCAIDEHRQACQGKAFGAADTGSRRGVVEAPSRSRSRIEKNAGDHQIELGARTCRDIPPWR